MRTRLRHSQGLSLPPISSRMKAIAQLFLSLVLLVATWAAPMSAADRSHATPAEAKAMLFKAIAHYESVGRKRALSDFTAKKPPFGDRDLYVVCIARNGVVVANGGFPGNLDTLADALIDVNGKGVGTAAWEVTSATGQGEVRYRWINPALQSGAENRMVCQSGRRCMRRRQLQPALSRSRSAGSKLLLHRRPNLFRAA